jgi:single-strand DNA-binding protein
MNTVNIIGNLARDPQIRATQSGKAVASFTVATNRNVMINGEKKQLTDWVSVTAWGNLAEAIGNSLKKGSYVFVSGRFSTRSYEKDGQKKYVSEVVASVVAIPLDTRSNQENAGNNHENEGSFSQFGTSQRDEDIPF